MEIVYKDIARTQNCVRRTPSDASDPPVIHSVYTLRRSARVRRCAARACIRVRAYARDVLPNGAGSMRNARHVLLCVWSPRVPCACGNIMFFFAVQPD